MMRGIALLIALLALAGCVSTPQLVPSAGEGAFAFSGRMAIKYDGQRSSANIRWSHRGEQDDILLLAPLGITVAHLLHDEKGVQLDTSGKHYEARDADTLMRQTLGWSMPLDGLQYWLRARARPGSPAEGESDTLGRYKELRQDGWEIHYPQYVSETAGSLPQRMSLHSPGLEILLVIDEWGSQ